MDLFVPILSAVIFLFVKLVEMKYVDQETKPLKFVIRDVIVVFVVSCASLFVYQRFFVSIHDFMSMVTSTKSIPMPIAPEIFTDSPGF